MSNSLDPDQDRHHFPEVTFQTFFQEHYQSFVGPDLGPNCLQRLLDDTSRRLQGKELNWAST